MSNEFNIDPNVWYQMTNDRFDPSEDSLRVGDGHTAIYMFATNLTSQQQRWQIFPVSDGGGWNFRNQVTGSGAFMSQCDQLSSTTASTDEAPDSTDVCMGLGSATDIQRRWILSSNGDGTLDIKLNNTNPLYQDYHLFDNSSNTVAFTNDTTETGVKWAFQSIMQINDPAFSTGIAAAATSSVATTSATATTTSASTSQTETQSSTSSPTSSSATSPDITSTKSTSSGLSSGAAAGIGVGVALLVLALAAIAFWLFRRRRRQSQAAPSEMPYNGNNAYHAHDNKAPYHDAPHSNTPYQNSAPPSELHHQSVAAELDTPTSRSHAAELPAGR